MTTRRVTLEIPERVAAWADREVKRRPDESLGGLVTRALGVLQTADVAHGDLAASILRSALDFAVLTFDDDGVVTSWSPGAEHLLEWSGDEVIGQPADLIFTPEDRAAAAPAKEFEQARLHGKGLDERWHLKADGSRFWASGLMMRLHDVLGEPDGFVKIVRDRTAERDVERRFNVITAALPGFVWIADADGLLVETNEGFRTFTGRSAEELNGDRWLDQVHEEDRDAARDRWTSSMAQGEAFRSRQRIRAGDGTYRCFDCHAVPEQDDTGQIIRWLTVCLDVDDEHRAQAALERLNVALEHRATQSTADLAAAIEHLQEEMVSRKKAEDAFRQSQKMEAVGQLTGGVAHDFNNLLTVIRSSVDLLRRPNLDPARRTRYLDAIGETADRAAALTSQLLAFARRQPLQPVVFDVASRVRAGEHILRTTIGSRVRLHIDIRCRACPALADPHQFDTAILNIVVNGRDAISGEGEITIAVSETDAIPARRNHAEQRGAFIEIAVTDTGCGIPADELALIFEPFFTTKPVGLGTGLGLSQVIGFAKQSNGDVRVDSRPGQGTTVRIFLPKADPETGPVQDVSEPVPEDVAGRSILVVEDNDMVGEFATQLLEDIGYKAHRVTSAQAALDALSQSPNAYDAVFSDVVMPGMNGLELADMVRRTHPNLPVVLTTGYSHVLADGGTHGFELLTKPYSADALSRVLQRVVPS